MQDLGTLGGNLSSGNAITRDGSVVVGGSSLLGGGTHAMLWNSTQGMVDLNTYLPSIGIDLTGWTLTSALGISADGSAIAGYGKYNGIDRAYLVTIPAPATPWVLAVGGVLVLRRRR